MHASSKVSPWERPKETIEGERIISSCLFLTYSSKFGASLPLPLRPQPPCLCFSSSLRPHQALLCHNWQIFLKHHLHHVPSFAAEKSKNVYTGVGTPVGPRRGGGGCARKNVARPGDEKPQGDGSPRSNGVWTHSGPAVRLQGGGLPQVGALTQVVPGACRCQESGFWMTLV